MRKISDTITRLAALRAGQDFQGNGQGRDRLSDQGDFGSNPGALRARIYVPDVLPEAAPLVVVLHGCTQTAAGYDHGSGWSQLADQEGFALLFPEQQRANNANLCFNWFVPSDTKRKAERAAASQCFLRSGTEDRKQRSDLVGWIFRDNVDAYTR